MTIIDGIKRSADFLIRVFAKMTGIGPDPAPAPTWGKVIRNQGNGSYLWIEQIPLAEGRWSDGAATGIAYEANGSFAVPDGYRFLIGDTNDGQIPHFSYRTAS